MFSLTARTTLRRAAAPSALSRASPVAVRFAGGHGSTSHDNDPEVLEREKKHNLAGTQHKSAIDNAPGWNELLSSASEAIIKAERSDDSPTELQKKTVEHIHSKHGKDTTVIHEEVIKKSA